MWHMKTISVRDLHNDTAKWLRAVKDEEEIVVTNRGVPIVKFVPILSPPKKRKTWAERTLRPGYAALMKAGKLKTTGDSSIGISEDRTSRDNSVAGFEE
jgi:prevent-host-death family protein